MSLTYKVKLKTKHFPKQKEVFNSILYDKYKFYCLNIGRGGGKTKLIEDIIIYYSLLGKKILVLSRTSDQLINNNMLPWLERIEASTLDLLKSSNKTQGSFKFKNGGYVKFKSADNPNSLRGANTYNIVIIDEFAFCKSDVWRELLQITKFKADGIYQIKEMTEKVILASTPNGYNHFYTAYTSELVDSEWKSFTYTSIDNPLVDPEKVKKDRLKIADIIARQEYDAEFLENGLSAFSNGMDACILNKQPYNSNYSYSAGLDIALSNDYTVLSIFNNNNEMVDYLRFNKCSTDIWLKKITNKLKEYNVKYLVAENNYEATLIQLLRKENNCTIEEFRTSASNKNKLIEDFIIEVDKKSIKLLNDDIIKGEFARFVQKKTTTGYSYSAISGHDDIIMSCAMANRALLRFKQGSIKVH